MMETPTVGFPVTLEIDYPERPLDRLTTLLRLFTIVPIVVILALVSTVTVQGDSRTYVLGSGGIVFVATILMLLFRRKYPRWWFDWNVELTKFSLRVSAYLALLRDEYPSTDAEQAVHVVIPYPDAGGDLSRWLPLVKWILAIPHFIVLALLSIAAVLCVIVAWFAILFTARYPRELFDFVVGVFRWFLRVSAYAFLLTTDRYPPFSLRP
jgi:hypothetical protein